MRNEEVKRHPLDLVSFRIKFRPEINGRTSDIVRPKSKTVRPNEKYTRNSVRREKFQAKLNVQP